jgi:hypothetical protein
MWSQQCTILSERIPATPEFSFVNFILFTLIALDLLERRADDTYDDTDDTYDDTDDVYSTQKHTRSLKFAPKVEYHKNQAY